jgi:hypothetical protein
LEEVLAGRSLDFVVLCSSLSAVLGGLGFAAYAAANLCMDAFAHRQSRMTAVPWISINWDGWRFDRQGSKPDPPSSDDLSIHPQEGAEAFSRILSMGVGPQITVSTGNLQARIDHWIGLQSLRSLQEDGDTREIAGSQNRPSLTTTYVAAHNELEEALVEMWQELLGVFPVGVHDDFFELGGHSLLGVQLNSRLRRRFEIDLPLRLLFDNPTVAELAEACELVLIEQIDELDTEQAERLLAGMPIGSQDA